MLSRTIAALLCCSPTLAFAADPPDAAVAAARVHEVIGHTGSVADRPGNTVIGVRRVAEVGSHAAEPKAKRRTRGLKFANRMMHLRHGERADSRNSGAARGNATQGYCE